MSKKCKTESAERTQTFAVRDDNGKIIKYTFEIYQKHEDPFMGEISRETMEAIKGLYTTKGAGFTQAQTYTLLADTFNSYTLHQFQQIIRAFKITKADSPFADHQVEELTNDELHDRLFRIKKTASIRRADVERFKDSEKLCKQLQKENLELTDKLNSLETLSASINLDKRVQWIPSETNSKNTIVITLTDMHIGCMVGEDSLYPNPYDYIEVERRLKIIFDKVWNLHKMMGGFKKIIVQNLGDTLDGMDAQTTRRDHFLPQNMSNKDQVNNGVELLFNFMDALADIPCEAIEYIAVGSSNHGGDFEWSMQNILKAQLEKLNIQTTIFDKFIGHYDVDDVTICCCHGKDEKDMRRPMPITLNDKTEKFINQYLTYNGIINKKILFMKGDSHVSAKTMGDNFIYKSVGAFIGNTGWTSANFGNTPAVCEYCIINGADIIDGSIDLR